MVTVILILLSGCTSIPTDKIDAFGLAALDVTNKIDAVLNEFHKANINNELVKMAQSRKKYVTSNMNSIKTIIIRDFKKKNFAIYKANHALGDYSKALSALAKAGSHDELELAGANLSNSLKRMNIQYKKIRGNQNNLISNKNSGKISRAFAELASFYFEYKRGKALKDIIIAADPSIQTIGQIIHDQLLKNVIGNRLYTMRYSEMAGYFDDYNIQVKANNPSFVKKKKMLWAIYEKYLRMLSSTATIVQAQKAILSIMKAHAELRAESEKNCFNIKNITKTIENIKTVHNNFNDLEELIQNCETEIIFDAKTGLICKEVD
jgi:hypothetical protein